MRGNPGWLLGNIRAASDLLDKAAQHRSELVALEERAISTFLDYQLAESLQPSGLLVSKLALKANRKISGADESDATTETLDQQDLAQTMARRLRIALHSAEGHPLNYGERITQHRKILTEILISALDRLLCVRVGLAQYGIATIRPVPDWDRERSNNLQELIVWLFEAIRLYELSTTRRVEFFKHIFLGVDAIIGGSTAAVQQELTSGGNPTFRFSLQKSQLGIPENSSAVITDLSVALSFSENFPDFNTGLSNAEEKSKFSLVDSWYRKRRELMHMNCVLTLPPQLTSIDKGISWARPSLDLNGIAACWRGEFRSALPAPEVVLGANPIGEWELQIQRELRLTSGEKFQVDDLREGVHNYLLQAYDVVLSLKLQRWV